MPTVKRSPYARTPFASLTNEGAGEYYGRTGTMPKSTYGGKFGLGLTNPDNRLGAKQVLANATGNQYAPMGGPRLGLAPTTPAGFNTAMQQQNPGGVHFGGALPALGLSSGGQMRPQFMSGPVAPSGYASAGHLDPYRTQRPHEPLGLSNQLAPVTSETQKATMAAAKSRFLAAHPNDVPLEQRYHGLGLATPAERGVNRFEKAFDKRESRRLDNGIVNFEQRLGLANPAAFQQRKVGEANIAASAAQNNATNAYRTAALDQQGKLGLANIEGLNQRAKITAQGNVLAHGGDATALGLAGPVAGALPKAEQDFRAAALEDPEKAVAMRVAQGKTVAQARGEVANINHSDLGKLPLENYWNGPGSALYGLFGPKPPAMVRPARRGKPVR